MLEKIIVLEQFPSQYIVIGIQAVTHDGSQLQHVQSIVVKVGGGFVQFDVDGMLNNLSSSGQGELAELLQLKYSPWMATDVDSKSRRLNQLLQALIRFSRPASNALAASRPRVIPIDASPITASGSRA